MKKLLAILLSMFMLLSLVACGDKDDPPVGGGKTPPTASQWADAGISGTFTADVKGELALSVVDNGEISMKWTGSDEASLDNTITWLKGQGFTSYGGQNAEKSTEEGGKIKSYTAEKMVSGVNPVSASADGGYSVVPLSFTLTASADESKRMIAETFYITEDFSIMGQSFKAGELYLDIYEATTPGSTSSLLTAWPASEIQNALGESIPAYTGTASGYKFVNGSLGSIKNLQVNVFGAGEEDATAYKNLLAQNGYVLNDDVYEKTLTSGDKIQIMAFASQGYHPDTFQMTDVVNIMIMLEKNSGAYTAWSSLNLSVFNGAGIPAYSGGTSFDLDDIGAETIKSEKETIEQAIAMMAAYESMLDAEQKAELAALRAQLPYFDEIECYMITVYGTNADQVDAYETALTNAGFSYGVKKTADYEFEVDVNEYDSKAIITITRMPIELLDDSSGSGQGDNTPVEDETLDFSDLPTNVKFNYTYGGAVYTITKIGNDYLLSLNGTYVFLKASGNSWIEYAYSSGGWTEGSAYTELDDHSLLRSVADLLFNNDLSGFTKGASETVAGVACDVYTYTDNSAADYGIIIVKTKKVTAEGFVFYQSEAYFMNGQASSSLTDQITLWDTSVTEFDIAVPQ